MFLRSTQLPIDLYRYSKKIFLRRLALCFSLSMLFGALIILYGERIFRFGEESAPFVVICYDALVILVFFFIVAVRFRLFDRTFWGTVSEVHIESVMDNRRPGKPSRENLYIKNVIHLTIVLASGRTIKRKAFEGDAKLQQNLTKYEKGNKVFHLFGTNHIIVLPQKRDSYVECTVCQKMSPKDQKCCSECGHTLLKWC